MSTGITSKDNVIIECRACDAYNLVNAVIPYWISSGKPLPDTIGIRRERPGSAIVWARRNSMHVQIIVEPIDGDVLFHHAAINILFSGVDALINALDCRIGGPVRV